MVYIYFDHYIFALKYLMLIVMILLILLHNVSMILFIVFNEILYGFKHSLDIRVLGSYNEYTCLLFISLGVINIEYLNGMILTFSEK